MTETELLLLEILERVKKIEARSSVTCSEDKSMLIQQLEQRVNAFFDKAHANIPGPLARSVIQRMRAFVLANLATIKTQVEDFFDSGDFAAGVDFMTAFVRGNLGKVVPWYMRPFISESKLLEQVAVWLKSNANLFKDKIGELPPG